MPLRAQRFRDSATLVRCVDEGYRMMLGEPDVDAVKRLQVALGDLGYIDVGFVDGIWGDLTSKAVIAFKTDESLAPADPVASTGTIGRLDDYFAWETDDPDSPDPSIDGLDQLVRQHMGDVQSLIDQATSAIDAMDWGNPATEDTAASRAALVTHCGIDPALDVSPPSRALLEQRLAGARAKLSEGAISIAFADRATWTASTGASYYAAHLTTEATGVVTVSPAYRNALPQTDQYAGLLRVALHSTDPQLKMLGFPGTARYAALSAEERAVNRTGIAAFVLFVADGGAGVLHPPVIWGDLSSFPGR